MRTPRSSDLGSSVIMAAWLAWSQKIQDTAMVGHAQNTRMAP